ncbi:protein aurora borealis [Contarinia nasturtii]|uniref:protein aurora borealis n=1 Tax=Contarinia nasturtii TaxID=265458 RepID=UPI0012D3F544|nr:protein aurora borealis [Contarinia nasturtii]
MNSNVGRNANDTSKNRCTNQTTINSHSTSNSVTTVTKEFQTPNSIRKARNGTFHSFPIVNTPTPPSRFRKIVNPFEADITERLHLPLIDSPSLFHRPTTPQMCSTQLEFEWTIDEVSTLNPANVEAHETQFMSVVDPELEAKAQAAISSYFKEQIIVPSPVECPLRDQKIIISRDNQQQSRVMRDNCCQTELTLPPILPKNVEEALRPYFTFTQNQQTLPIVHCDSSCNTTMQYATNIDHDARDASLRRKLFQTATNTSNHSNEPEFERDVHLDSPAPQTPEMHLSNMRARRRFLTPYNNVQDENEPPLDVSLNSMGRESFGCISPISKSTTPQSRPKSLPSSRKKCEASTLSLFRSTPDRSSIGRWKSFDMSTDSAVNNGNSSKRKSFFLNDERSSESNETANFSYDEMQLSYGSQQHPITPTVNRSKRRCNSVNRKNLSRSFNQIEENQHSAISLDRTDSGFNENMNDCTATQSHSQLKIETNFNFHELVMKCNKLTNDKNEDISMASI